MIILKVLGVALALVGMASLVAPRPTAWVVGHGLGVRLPRHEAGRVAAWLLIVLGLLLALIGHFL